MEKRNFILILLAILFFSSFASALTTVVVVRPNGGETLNKNTIQTYDINWTVTGSDVNTFLVDINYSSSTSEGTGSVIINDVNNTGSSITCSATDFNQVTTSCRYTWNITGVPKGDYYIFVDANAGGGAGAGFDRSNSTFNVSNFVNQYGTTDIQGALIDIIAGFFVGIANNIALIVFVIVMALIISKVSIGKLFSKF